ncbi:hypothetical protein D5086_016872 [Populus alba]|uniref:Uncharacterized protein n=1 Tax=Populus alba TaxID=43335 RepID=A0ACC4BVX4_POPAL
MDENDLPFKVGQLAEARSFAQGYRGAWFRCKIIDIARRDSGMQYALQYYDFPDEKLNWTKLYQYPKPRLKNTERQLMVRPYFPSVYLESKLSEIKTISEVVVVVNDVWKVGDFVDWWTDGCYWSGRLTKELGNDKYQIDLFPPPAGEGSSYEASSKDFRPSLSWSPDNGWTVPVPSAEMVKLMGVEMVKLLGDRQSSSMCSVDQTCESSDLILGLYLLDMGSMMVAGSSTNLAVHAADKMRKDPEDTVGASYELNASPSSHIATSRSELLGIGPLNPAASIETRTPGRNIVLGVTNGGAPKSEVAEDAGGEDNDDNDPPLKKMRTDGGICSDSTCSDTIGAAILDLEVLVNRVKWMKDALKFGMPLSNTARLSWKFLEHRGPSRPE